MLNFPTAREFCVSSFLFFIFNGFFFGSFNFIFSTPLQTLSDVCHNSESSFYLGFESDLMWFLIVNVPVRNGGLKTPAS